MSARILIVEDEAGLARSVACSLQREGFVVALAATGREGLAALQADPPFDVVLLDLMLPDVSGTEICRQIRGNTRIRDMLVLMLTARGEEIDHVVGFEVGADDYLVKPFSTRELALRIRALLRRLHELPVDAGVLAWGPLRLDVDGHRCQVDGAPVVLTAIEVKPLSRLMARLQVLRACHAIVTEGRQTSANRLQLAARFARRPTWRTGCPVSYPIWSPWSPSS